MDRYPDRGECATAPPLPPEVYRVIDDGTCILTTMDARKALLALNKLIDKYDITNCWSDVEVLK